MARLPIGIVVITGRTSELKLFLFIARYSAALRSRKNRGAQDAARWSQGESSVSLYPVREA
jgi:hypothetical protein